MIKNKAIREELYNKNKAIRKVGVTCKCPSCGQLFTKKSYQQKFCSLKCKDYYHNRATPQRLARARMWTNSYPEYDYIHPFSCEAFEN